MRILFLLMMFVLSNAFAYAQNTTYQEIPYCPEDPSGYHYSFEYDDQYIYDISVVNGEIIDQIGGDLFIDWDLFYVEGSITVTVTNQYDCYSMMSLRRVSIPCDKTTIYIPTSFTPNNDGDNDVFTAKGTNISDYEMKIYDRWGEEIYFTGNIYGGWDGYYKGRRCQNGVYTYYVSYRDHRNYNQLIVGKVVLVY